MSCVLAFGQYSMDTITVRTSNIPLKIKETGRSITVINSAEIKEIAATSIDEVLQTVTGVEVQSRSGFGAQGDILMRGSTFTQVMILIDGMKLNDPLTGHFNSYIPVTPSEIERIEVLRGAAAAMYGADAVGGVINIITKTFSNTQKDLSIDGSINYGSHQLVNGYQGFQISKGNSTFGGGFSINQSAGERFPEQFIDSSTTLEAYDTYFDIKTIGASFGHQFDNGYNVKLRTSYDYRDFNARYFYTTSPFDKSEENVANWWNHMQISKAGQNSFSDFNLAYKYNTDEFVFSPDFPSINNHVSQFLNATLNHMQMINEQFKMKAGLQVDHRQIESNDRGDHKDLHMGIYAMGVLQQNNLNLSLSLRGDYDENYQFEFTPQVNFSYVLPRITLRGSAGRSIRAADYTERYVSNNLQNLTPGRSLGNPDLLAERSWSQEIGFDYKVLQNWTLSATGFARQSSNLIDYVSTNEEEIGVISENGSLQEGADYFFAKNISDVNTQGLEFESNLRVKLGMKGSLGFKVGYTYLDTYNEEDVVSVYISSHARHLVTNTLSLDWGRVNFSLQGLFKERMARIAEPIQNELEDSYLVWNTRLGLNITNDLGLNLQVQNIFDEDYQNILGARMPGRWLMAGLKWNL